MVMVKSSYGLIYGGIDIKFLFFERVFKELNILIVIRMDKERVVVFIFLVVK